MDDQKQQLFATQLSSVHGIRIERVADQKARWPEGGWVPDYIDEKVGLPDDQFAVFPTTSIKNAELSGIPFEAGKKYTMLFKQNATGFTAGFTFVGVLPKKAVQVIAVGAGQGFKLNFTFM